MNQRKDHSHKKGLRLEIVLTVSTGNPNPTYVTSWGLVVLNVSFMKYFVISRLPLFFQLQF